MIAVVECVKGSNQRNEFIDGKMSYMFDVKKPWIENYGFLEDTLQADGDALDCYIVGKKHYEVGERVVVGAVASIICFDEGKRDDKMIVIDISCKVSWRRVNRLLKRLVHTIRKYKKGTVVLGVRKSPDWLYYELLKCHEYKELFSKGE